MKLSRGRNHPAALVAILFAFPFAALSPGTAIVWNGPLISFTKPNGADWTLPANQDPITPLVVLTRAFSLGLFNVQAEPAFTHLVSPAGTAWAFGTTATYSALTYTDWETWTGGMGLGPPSTIGRDAVVHLLAEDVYLDLKFTSWTSSALGGGFSYVRSTVPEPGSLALLGVGAVALAARRRSGSAHAGGRIA